MTLCIEAKKKGLLIPSDSRLYQATESVVKTGELQTKILACDFE
jgi:hypothetical protein